DMVFSAQRACRFQAHRARRFPAPANSTRENGMWCRFLSSLWRESLTRPFSRVPLAGISFNKKTAVDFHPPPFL
ncbi:MAG: hypothetical protein ACR2M7_00915, partial [Bdellovibrionales bacterium]